MALCQGLLSTHRFQSTPPSRVATASTGVRNGRGDDFNPHHPRGWRLQRSAQKKGRKEFQSTPPSRVATLMYCDMEGFAIEISIHTTLAGGDLVFPVPPFDTLTISIHTTLAGGDVNFGIFRLALEDFNPHHPRGWRLPLATSGKKCLHHFNPHHPRGWRPDETHFVFIADPFQSTPPSRVATITYFLCSPYLL